MTDITEKHAALDEAAYRVFYDVGFKEASISKITDLAQMATGSFYNYYQSKEEIFTKIFINENKRIYDELRETVNFDDDVLVIFDQAVEHVYNIFKENKIVTEFFNPEVNKFLKKSMKEQGVDIIFNDYIKQFTDEKFKEAGYSDDQIKDFYKVANLLSFLEGHLIHTENEDYFHSYRTLMRYYIKGIFNS